MPVSAIEKSIDHVVAKQHLVEVGDVDLIGVGRPDLARAQPRPSSHLWST